MNDAYSGLNNTGDTEIFGSGGFMDGDSNIGIDR